MKPKINEVVDCFAPYYQQHPCWGSLHNVLDDGNVSDANVEWCLNEAQRTGDDEGAELARILLTMSKTQRLALPGRVVKKYPLLG